MIKQIIMFFIAFFYIFGVEAQTTKHFDIIKNNDNTDITLDPAGAVIFNYGTADTIPYLDANKKLISTSVTKTIFDYIGGLTSDAQTQIDSKVSLTGNESISGIKTFTTQLVATSTVDGSHPAPTMTEAERDLITGMVAGDLIFNSTSSTLNIYNGVGWVGISGSGGVPLMAKGSILTSNGLANGEFSACTNGESLEWDSAEVAGVKCVTAGGGGGGDTVAYTDGGTFQFTEDTGGTTVLAIPALDTNFTTNASGNPVEIYIDGAMINNANVNGSSETDVIARCALRIKRGTSLVGNQPCNIEGRTNSASNILVNCAGAGTTLDLGSSVSTAYTYHFELLNETSAGYIVKQCLFKKSNGGNISVMIRQAP